MNFFAGHETFPALICTAPNAKCTSQAPFPLVQIVAVSPPALHLTLAAVILACIALLSANFDSHFRANQNSQSMALLDCAAVRFGIASEKLEPMNP